MRNLLFILRNLLFILGVPFYLFLLTAVPMIIGIDCGLCEAKGKYKQIRNVMLYFIYVFVISALFLYVYKTFDNPLVR